MSYVLRHAPWIYELELDNEGWVPTSQLLDGLRGEQAFQNVNEQDFEAVIKNSEHK